MISNLCIEEIISKHKANEIIKIVFINLSFTTDLLEKKSVNCYKKNINHYFYFNNKTIVDELNTIKKNIIEKIKHKTNIIEYSEQKSYNLKLKYFNKNNSIMFNNIIEYNNLTNNLNFYTLSNVLSLCKCYLLLNIESVTITNKNVYLNIYLEKVYPESIINLNLFDRLNIMNDKLVLKNNNINIDFSNNKRPTKNEIKEELKRLMI